MMLKNYRVKIIRFQLQLLALVVFPVLASSQTTNEMKNIFTKAESYYIYEEYELANQLYLLIDAPDNMNIKYKIGTCYLNIPSEKEKSIPYLEEAVKTASYDSKTESFKEKRAPLDAYFFLAKAYMINNEFEKALLTFQTFNRLAKATKSKGGMENLDYIDQQIQACNNAVQFRKVPSVFTKEALGSDLNLGSINENPAVSFDGNTMVYTERRGIVNVIYFTKKKNGKWQPPVEITAQLKAGVDCSSCSLNYDGTELFLYKTDNYDGSLYSSGYVDSTWTPIKKLNKNINSKFYESHASISSDGKKLYFASNRDGGQGKLDIYVSEKDKTGDWGPAVNLGPTINTPFNEDIPFITENGSVLYFCSEGHNSMGGYDNFKSQKTGTGWMTPSNLGYPINSADDDKFYQPINNEQNAYYSLITDYKKKDIFYLSWAGNDIKPIYKISGKFLLNDTTLIAGKEYSVKVLNKVSGDTIYKGYPDKKTGLYSINVAPGIFKVLYTSEGYLPQIIDTVIIKNNQKSVINLDITLYRDTIPHVTEPVKYDKIDPLNMPVVASIDSSILIRNMNVNNVRDKSVDDSDFLYYTVQVIALHRPVDVSYFKYVNDMKVIYNDKDKFYRYTTGQFQTREEAYSLKQELITKGYSKRIFIRKVSKQ